MPYCESTRDCAGRVVSFRDAARSGRQRLLHYCNETARPLLVWANLFCPEAAPLVQ